MNDGEKNVAYTPRPATKVKTLWAREKIQTCRKDKCQSDFFHKHCLQIATTKLKFPLSVVSHFERYCYYITYDFMVLWDSEANRGKCSISYLLAWRKWCCNI